MPPNNQQAKDIAIIGMALKVGDADNPGTFWQQLAWGHASIRDLPASRRKDVEQYLCLKHASQAVKDEDYLREAYLNDIDKFDYAFFGLSKQEANLMDPDQRLFLETAWQALEDAGHCGEGIKGSKTGMFCGFSNDFGEDYRRLIETLAPDAPEIAIVGNIKSVIASRLSYILDLKGPSLLVDTACSSSLVALHLACRSLRSGECNMALVGAVKTHLIPLLEDPTTGVGMKDIADTYSSDDRTKTFDDSSDGMSVGEGVFAFVLKPLADAERDGDQVHAVIRGSAINQDGKSAGLTAPNNTAQATLIRSALSDAHINAKDVSYIEAHGTGTRLGDPIEVSGIKEAFTSDTSRKQFCAIGSVKTNVGHLDNAAGLSGLSKVVLSLKNKQLPASLFFDKPNTSIGFEQTPTYVNDRLTNWEVAEGKPRIAGINSFGLSGTNCHVVVSSYEGSADLSTTACENKAWILPLSAKSPEQLRDLANAYLTWLEEQSGTRIEDLCFTAAAGRQHHDVRAAFLFTSLTTLTDALLAFVEQRSGDYYSTAFHGAEASHQNQGGTQMQTSAHLTSESQLEELSHQLMSIFPLEESGEQRQAKLSSLAEGYCKGADASLLVRYLSDEACRRVSLPTYPFARHRCWVEATPAGEALSNQRYSPFMPAHPLIDQKLVDSFGVSVYRTTCSEKRQWALAEHKVRGMYVLPGTCYIEIILALTSRLGSGNFQDYSFNKVQFLTPFMVGEDEYRALDIQIEEQGSGFVMQIGSGSGDNGQLHCVAEIEELRQRHTAPKALDLNNLKKALGETVSFTQDEDLSRGLEIGDRWNYAFQEGWGSSNGDQYLIRLALKDTYHDELEQYFYHPALLDTAINAANHLLGNGELYLPLAYETLRVYKALPADCFVNLHLNGARDTEVVSLRVTLTDLEGNICATVDNYRVKRVADEQQFSETEQDLDVFAVAVQTNEQTLEEITADTRSLRVLLVTSPHADVTHIEQVLTNNSIEYVALDVEDHASWHSLLHERVSHILYGEFLGQTSTDASNTAFHRFKSFVNYCVNERVQPEQKFIVLTRGAFALSSDINPLHTAATSFARVASLENPQLSMTCLDITGDIAFALLSGLTESEFKPLQIHQDNKALECVLHQWSFPDLVREKWLSQGTYLISGGIGALGLAIAKRLAEEAQAQSQKITLVLTSRSDMPPASEWEGVANGDSTEKGQKETVKQLLAIQDTGAVIITASVDVSDDAAMASLLQSIRIEHGQLKGVIHAAGVAGDGFLVHKPDEEMQKVLLPKVQGTVVLDALTREDPLDFFIMYSSIASLIIEPGQSDYSAANSFMNAKAEERRQQGLPAVSVCWPAWREVGIAVNYGAVNEEDVFSPIDTKEALDGLTRVIAAGNELPPTVVLSRLKTGATDQDIASLDLTPGSSVKRKLRHSRQENEDASPSISSSTSLIGIEDADEFDDAAANIWGRVLGLSELDADEPFNNLGGNSILTTQKYKAYESLFPGVIDMADLFTYTTIREQAAFLRKALGKSEPAPVASEKAPIDSDMDDILAKLARGELSAEEAEALF
nr:beta-ketoacyl synthase N-terminal-like domain-containing protein [Vibrio sp. Of7-15]